MMNGPAIPIVCDNVELIPQYATLGSVGADLRLVKTVAIAPGETKRVWTGLRIQLPKSYVGLICSRSSWAEKGLVVANQPGVLDGDYRGDVSVLLRNRSDEYVVVPEETAVAQLLIVPIIQAKFIIVDKLDPTERGEGGFGSTDTT